MEDGELDELRIVFLDECLEHMEIFENCLIRLDAGETAYDVINQAFRAAHSMKSGAITFGIVAIAELTDHIETLLHTIRLGGRTINDSDIGLLFEGLDQAQQILSRSNRACISDHENRQKLQKLLKDAATRNISNTHSSQTVKPSRDSVVNHWIVKIIPEKHFYKSGHEPLLLLRELSRVADTKVSIIDNTIADWAVFDHTAGHIGWKLEIRGDIRKSELEELFTWINSDCEIEIQQNSRKPDRKSFNTRKPDSSTSNDILEFSKSEADSVLPFQNQLNIQDNNKIYCCSFNNKAQSSIRIKKSKLHRLVDLSKSLSIHQSVLSNVDLHGHTFDHRNYQWHLDMLEKCTAELLNTANEMQMLPLSNVFERLPRLVRDLSKRLDKQVDLIFNGDSIEVDKSVIDKLIDPIVHIVRNALDHGLENPDTRAESGKPRTGKLKLIAQEDYGDVVIRVSDDGAGIDTDKILSIAIEKGIVTHNHTLSEKDIQQLLFTPGFTTTSSVNDISGRGVGMDVVRRNILDLGGQVKINSRIGVGSIIEIRLPSTLSMIDGLLVKAGSNRFILPARYIIDILDINNVTEHSCNSNSFSILYQGKPIDLIDILLNNDPQTSSEASSIIIVESNIYRFGLRVEHIYGEYSIALIPVTNAIPSMNGADKATYLKDGSIAWILSPDLLHQNLQMQLDLPIAS